METTAIAEFHHADLKPGSKQCRRLYVAESLNGAITVPLLTCRGSQAGPVLLVVAGIHGDEFEGMAAIHRTFAQLDPARMSGTFLALPVANPWAFDAQIRESPAAVDGKNLARVFPGNGQGSPTDRLAYTLFQFVMRNLTDADLLVDLHSGGSRYRYLPMAGYRDIAGPARAPSIEAARHFGIDRMWIIPDAPGPLNAETARAGIPTVGTEITGQGGCLEEDAELYTEGLLNSLGYLGILKDVPSRRTTTKALATCWLYVTQYGLFTPSVDLGSRVEPGQLLATIIDSYGEIREEVRAEQAGYIWALRTFPSVLPGDIAFVLAYV